MDWTLTIKKNKHGTEQVEIKDGLGIVIVVSIGEGYVYKGYGSGKWQRFLTDEQVRRQVVGVNIHMAMNGPLQCSFLEFDQIHSLIQIARSYLYGERDNVDINPGM